MKKKKKKELVVRNHKSVICDNKLSVHTLIWLKEVHCFLSLETQGHAQSNFFLVIPYEDKGDHLTKLGLCVSFVNLSTIFCPCRTDPLLPAQWHAGLHSRPLVMDEAEEKNQMKK